MSSAWRIAVGKSRGVLSDEERARLGKSGPEDIVLDFQTSHWARAQTSKIQMFLAKLQPFVSAIERYGRSFDVVSNTSPELLSPIWGVLRALLLIVKDYEAYFSKFMDMLQQIGDTLPRFKAYERLFQSHQSLQQALCSVYLELISFLERAKKVFSASSFRLFSLVLWRSFDQTFHDSLAQLKRCSDLVEREAKLAHMLEESQARMELTRLRALIETKPPTLRRWLGARSCDEERDESEGLPGTCTWILDRPELSTWIDSHDAHLLWVHGPPGCGKSVLFGKILRYINTDTKLPCVYFFFCGADGERVSLSSLLRSWVFQLAESLKEAKEHVCQVQLASENHQATARETHSLFLSLLEFLPACVLAVDGVDECTDRQELCQLLMRIPKRFKIFMASRYLPDLAAQLQRERHLSLEISPEMTRADIDQYITSELKKPDFQLPSPLLSHVHDRLACADGLFLWVRLMIQHIRDQTTEEEIIQCLGERELPATVSEQYDRILRNIENLPKPRRLLAHKVFFWVTTARRPLRIRELSGLLAVKPSSGREHAFELSRRIANDPESAILSACGSLVTVRGTNRDLYPIHFTVTEYLRRYMATSERLEEMTAYYDSQQLQTSDGLAAAVCMRYLALDFIAEIREKTPQQYSDALSVFGDDTPELHILQYAVTQWFHHLQRVETPEPLLLALADELLDEMRPNIQAIWHLYWFSQVDSAESTICPGQFTGIHVVAYFGLHQVLRHFLQTRNPATLDGSGRSALWWTASRGYRLATKVLVEAGVDPHVPDNHSIAPVHRAAASGDADVFGEMIRTPHTLEKGQAVVDAEGWTPLHWNVSSGHFLIAHRILGYRGSAYRVESYEQYGTLSSRTQLGRTPLHHAALSGNSTLIQGLGQRVVQRHNHVNAQDIKGQTALHLAAAFGHLRTAEILVRYGASTAIQDHAGKTAAERAADMGNNAISAMLVKLPNCYASITAMDVGEMKEVVDRMVKYEIGTRKNSLDTQDMSAMHAIMNSHHQSLRLLFEKGRNPRGTDKRGRTLLHQVAATGNINCAQEIVGLIRYKGFLKPAFVNRQDDRGWTALHYAATERSDMMVKIILQSGVSVRIRNTVGLSAYDIALKGGHRETVEAVARYGHMPTEEIAKDFGMSELHCLARQGSLSLTEQVDGASVKAQDSFGRTPAYRALEAGHWDAAKMLIGHAELGPEDIIDLAMVIMEEKDNQNTLSYILGRLPPFSILSTKKEVQRQAQHLLVASAKHNDVASIVSLTAAGVPVDSLSKSHLEGTALQVAIEACNTEAAVCLIESGADITFTDPGSGGSALHLACYKHLPEVAQSLLDHGADANGLSIKLRWAFGHEYHNTPFHLTLQNQQQSKLPENGLKIIRLLLGHRANVLGTMGEGGMPPGWMAVQNCHQYSHRPQNAQGHQDILNLIAASGYEMIAQPVTEKLGYAPIHIATERGDMEGVKAELDKGVPVDWRAFAYPYPRPLNIAVAGDDCEMAAFLLRHGASLEGFGDEHEESSIKRYWDRGFYAESEDMKAVLTAGFSKRELTL